VPVLSIGAGRHDEQGAHECFVLALPGLWPDLEPVEAADAADATVRPLTTRIIPPHSPHERRLYPTAECPRCDDLDVREVPPVGVERWFDWWECLGCGYLWALPLGRVLRLSGGTR